MSLETVWWSLVRKCVPDETLRRWLQYKVHRDLTALYRTINRQKREWDQPEITTLVKPRPVKDTPDALLMRQMRRDPAVATLATKAATTKEAIRVLLNRGWTTDAYGLCRVLMENAIVVGWLLHDDERIRKMRLDTYILHTESLRVRLDTVERKEYAETGETPSDETWADDRAREISSDVFDDKWVSWAFLPTGKKQQKRLVKLREMAEELGIGSVYDRYYFEMCQFVHSAPGAVCGGPMEERKHWVIEAAQPVDFHFKTLMLSNLFMWNILSSIQRIYDFGMLKRLTEIGVLMMRGVNLDSNARADEGHVYVDRL